MVGLKLSMGGSLVIVRMDYHGLLTELETSMDEPTHDIDYLQEPSENGILMRETIVTKFFQ